jgi:ubiquitin-like domain-containing CTD phosphatase 1
VFGTRVAINQYEVSVVESDTVGDLKTLLWSLTSVPPERQKVRIGRGSQRRRRANTRLVTQILGLVKGKLPGDEAEVMSLGLLQGGTKAKEFMMVRVERGGHLLELTRKVVVQVGTPEGEEHKEVGPPPREQEVDVDYTSAEYKAAQNVRNR